MRRSLALALLLLLAACGRGDEGENSFGQSGGGGGSSASSSDASSTARSAQSAGPDIAVSAAPGVAFNYRYSVRLEAERIAGVMEQQAAFCERQGLNVCRVVGMEYRRHGDGDVTGRLSVKLAPNVARQFGQRGVQAVTEAGGLLVESEISGTEVAPTIRAAGRSIEQASAELARIQARLRESNLGAIEREGLEAEANQLRASIRADSDTRDEAEASLAQTPLTFHYGSGDRVPGYQDDGLSMREAAREAKDNFMHVLAGIFVVLITLLPFAILGLLGWAAALWFRRQWERFTGKPIAPAPPPPGPDA